MGEILSTTDALVRELRLTKGETILKGFRIMVEYPGLSYEGRVLSFGIGPVLPGHQASAWTASPLSFQ